MQVESNREDRWCNQPEQLSCQLSKTSRISVQGCVSYHSKNWPQASWLSGPPPHALVLLGRSHTNYLGKRLKFQLSGLVALLCCLSRLQPKLQAVEDTNSQSVASSRGQRFQRIGHPRDRKASVPACCTPTHACRHSEPHV